MRLRSSFRVMRSQKNLARVHDDGNPKPEKNWNIIEIISLSIGTLGFGVYIANGYFAYNLTGPAIILSFSLTAIISLITSLFYVELFGRIPSENGSSINYINSYICEFIAFIVGWSLLLDYIIAAACAARGFTLYLDTLLDDILIKNFKDTVPISWENVVAEYFDPIGFALPILITVGLAVGLSRYGLVSTVLTVINIGFIIFLIVLGIIKADESNYYINSTSANPAHQNYTLGDGGFMPFSINRTFEAIAISLFLFIGVETLSTLFHTKNITNSPKKVPIAYFTSWTITFLLIFLTGLLCTLMWPYYKQQSTVWMLKMFDEIDWRTHATLIGSGAVIALFVSCYGFLHSSRFIISLLAEDAYIFKKFGKIRSKSNAPVIGIILCGIISGIFAGLFSVEQLMNMLGLGTLFTYTSLAVIIILIRYTKHEPENTLEMNQMNSEKARIKFQFSSKQKPTKFSSNIVRWLVLIFIVSSLALSLMLSKGFDDIYNGEIYAIVLTAVFGIITVTVLLILIPLQSKQIEKSDYFNVPLVPVLPGIVIFIDIFLITMFTQANWIAFGIWTFIGLLIYFRNISLRENGVRNKSITSVKIDEKPVNGHIPITIENEIINKEEKIQESKYFIEIEDEPETEIVTEIIVHKSIITSEPEQCDELNQDQKIASISSSSSSSSPTPPPPPILINGKKSPSSSVDEINILSEIEDTLKEKKERNGSTYFVEDDPDDVNDVNNPEDKKSVENDVEIIMNRNEIEFQKQDIETNSVLAYLDNVIETEEQRPRSIIEDDEIISMQPISTSAIIHRENDTKPEEEPKCEPIEKDLVEEKLEKQIPDVLKASENKDTEQINLTAIEPTGTNHEDPTKTITEEPKELDFKAKLSLLIGQPRPQTFLPKQPNSKPNLSKSAPRLHHSKSESNLQFKELLVNFEQDKEKPNSELKLQSAISMVDVSTDKSSTEKETEQIPIPAAPVFDTNLWNSIGKKPNETINSTPRSSASPSSQIPSNQQSPVQSRTPTKPCPSVKINKKTGKLVAPPDSLEYQDKSAIKQKLEAIFKAGLPLLGKPNVRPKPPKPPSTEQDEDPQSENKANEDIELNKQIRHDTVKLRFSEVLKAIKEDTKPSVIRNSSFKKLTTDNHF